MVLNWLNQKHLLKFLLGNYLTRRMGLGNFSDIGDGRVVDVGEGGILLPRGGRYLNISLMQSGITTPMSRSSPMLSFKTSSFSSQLYRKMKRLCWPNAAYQLKVKVDFKMALIIKWAFLKVLIKGFSKNVSFQCRNWFFLFYTWDILKTWLLSSKKRVNFKNMLYVVVFLLFGFIDCCSVYL